MNAAGVFTGEYMSGKFLSGKFLSGIFLSGSRCAQYIIFFAAVLLSGNANAACSAYQGKVAINEYSYIENWIA